MISFGQSSASQRTASASPNPSTGSVRRCSATSASDRAHHSTFPPTASDGSSASNGDEVAAFIESCRIEPGTLEHLYPDTKDGEE